LEQCQKVRAVGWRTKCRFRVSAQVNENGELYLLFVGTTGNIQSTVSTGGSIITLTASDSMLAVLIVFTESSTEIFLRFGE
jgi:hypothetical protein